MIKHNHYHRNDSKQFHRGIAHIQSLLQENLPPKFKFVYFHYNSVILKNQCPLETQCVSSGHPLELSLNDLEFDVDYCYLGSFVL